MAAANLLMGVVGKPHGVRGLVHVHAYAEDPKSLAGHALRDERGRGWRLAWRGEGVAELTAEDGRKIADRTAAAKLVNTQLFVERAALPSPAEDEFYLADLIGMAALAEGGAALGRVAAVHDYGAGASLEIARPDAAALLVPFTRAAVPSVDVQAGTLTIVPPAEIVLEGEAPDAAPLTGEVAA